MSYTKKILCLAKSWKRHGHCVAGRTYSSEGYLEWVRPVSDRPEEEISDDECGYESGEAVEALEFVEVPLSRAVPKLHQVENHVIDPTKWWRRINKLGTATWDDLQLAVQTPATLWPNGRSYSSYNGTNDRVPEAVLAQQGASLYLIQPENVQVTVGMEGLPGHQHRNARATFEYRGTTYSLVVTDPVASNVYKQNGDGTHALTGEMLFCVSLGGILNRYAYKLVAGVFTPTRTRTRDRL